MIRAALAFGLWLAVLGCGSREAPPPKNEMLPVAAGWFTAGCTGLPPAELRAWVIDRCLDNVARRVWVSAFEMDRYETSQAEYAACVTAHACPPQPAFKPGMHRIGPAYPVRVPWRDASAYCTWRGARLPSSAEWEKAARGTDERFYPWGDAPPDCRRASFDLGTELPAAEDCHDVLRPSRIGAHPTGASPYGVEDLFGNVGEWTQDLHVPLALEHMEDVPRFAPTQRDGVEVLAYDASSVRFHFVALGVVDPIVGVDGMYLDASVLARTTEHTVKGGRDAGTIASRAAFDSFSTLPDDDPARWVAGFRCVRAIGGPPPPVVPPLRQYEYRLPFHERELAPAGG